MVTRQLPSATKFAEWKASRYVDRAVGIHFSETATRELAWSQAKLFADIPEKGRELFQGTGRERSDRWRHFGAFLRQAEAYDQAAALTDGASRSLLIYYSLLNLAKAELLRSHPQLIRDASIHHGLSVRLSKSSQLNGDYIQVQDGVFKLLYETRTRLTLPAKTRLSVRRLFAQVPELAANVNAALGDTPKCIPFCSLIARSGRTHWFLVMTPHIDGYKTMGSWTSRLFQSHFKPVSLDGLNWRALFDVSPRSGWPNPLVFEGRKYLGETAAKIALAGALGSIVGPTEREDFDFQISPNLFKTRALYMPTCLARYALLYYASSLVRYRPARVDPRVGGKTAWLIESLANESHLPSLVSGIGGAIEADIFFSTPTRR